MALGVDPENMKRIFGGMNNMAQGQGGNYLPLANMGMAMSQAANQPNSNFGQAMQAGLGGLLQGQQQSQQMAMQQQQMRIQQEQMEQRQRQQEALNAALFGSGDPNLYQEAAGQVQQPQQPAQPQSGPQTSPVRPPGQSMTSSLDTWQQMFPELQERVFQAESGNQQFGGPSSVAGPNEPTESPAGALGAAQMLASTGPEAAQMAGMEWDPQRFRSDGDYNRALGSAYLNNLGQRYDGDPVLATAAYNWGMGNVDDLLQRVGDPRDNPENYDAFVANLPGETRDYVAKTVGPQLQQMAMQQEQGGMQQPQQPMQQGGMQQQPQQPLGAPGSGPMGPAPEGQDAGMDLPLEVERLLMSMDPQDAAATVMSMRADQQQGIDNLPAEVQGLRWALGDEGAREYYQQQLQQEAQGGGATTTTQTREQQVDALMRADPSLSRDQATNQVYGRLKTISNSVTGEPMVIDTITGERVNDVDPGQVESAGQPAKPGDAPDVSLSFGAPAVFSNVANSIMDTLGQELPYPEVENAIARVRSLGMQGDILLSQQFSGRVSNQLLDMIGELKAKPATVFQGPARGRERFEEMRRLVGNQLERNQRIAADRTQGAEERRTAQAAVEALSDYRNELDSVLNAYGSGNPGAPGAQDAGQQNRQRMRQQQQQAPQGWEDEWDWLTDEEKQEILEELQ